MGSVGRKSNLPVYRAVVPSSSLPVWGAWVEKDPGETTPRHGPVAPRMGSVGRKLAPGRANGEPVTSLPVWGVRIEI